MFESLKTFAHKIFNKCSHMDGPRVCQLSEVKFDREGEILYDIPYMWNRKINYTNELLQNRDSQT